MINSAHENGVYTHHLSKVNERNAVIAIEDICNDKGVLLVKKNGVIDARVAIQIAKHKLRKSISLSVSLENTLDERGIYSAVQEYLTKHKFLEKIVVDSQLNKKIQMGCLFAKQFPMLLQQLTVMQSNMPELFQKSIAGAWFAVAIGYQLAFDVARSNQIFLAALIRDVGMMYIEPDLLNNPPGNNPDYYKIIQSHVIIGKLAIEDTKDLPLLVKQAVFEHHERSDGAGYPKAKQLGSLTQEGQVVAMSDAIQAIIYNRFKGTDQNIANLEGFLTLNMTTYSEEIYQAVVRMVRVSQCLPVSLVGIVEFAGFIDKLVQTNLDYNIICKAMVDVSSKFQGGQLRIEESLLSNFLDRITKMQARTGVPSEEYGRFMLYVKDNELIEAYAELEMINAMFEELKWQFVQMKRYISALWKLPTISKTLQLALEDLMAKLEKAT